MLIAWGDPTVHQSVHICQTGPLAASTAGWAGRPGPESYSGVESLNDDPLPTKFDNDGHLIG